MSNIKYSVTGKIVDQKSGRPIIGVLIEAWDKDLIFDDLVGSTISNQAGWFRFEFNQSYFQDLFEDRKPDLYFKVIHRGKVVTDTKDDVLWNYDNQHELLEIKVDQTDILPEPQVVLKIANAYNIGNVLRLYAATENLPLEIATQHAQQLKAFLALAAITGESYGITGVVEKLWRIFILFSDNYTDFCNKVANYYIHYFPYVPNLPNPEIDQDQVRRNYERFLADYQSILEIEPPLHLWPRLTDIPATTGLGRTGSPVIAMATTGNDNTTTANTEPPPPPDTESFV